jgi:hypothetical protein
MAVHPLLRHHVVIKQHSKRFEFVSAFNAAVAHGQESVMQCSTVHHDES